MEQRTEQREKHDWSKAMVFHSPATQSQSRAFSPKDSLKGLVTPCWRTWDVGIPGTGIAGSIQWKGDVCNAFPAGSSKAQHFHSS